MLLTYSDIGAHRQSWTMFIAVYLLDCVRSVACCMLMESCGIVKMPCHCCNCCGLTAATCPVVSSRLTQVLPACKSDLPPYVVSMTVFFITKQYLYFLAPPPSHGILKPVASEFLPCPARRCRCH
ncbi:hypothetical protein BDR07DRAFT_889943 [Suillus spraguei]|nr:hypothetical protein BDR07DRAFT_889943 [Suillus spraguei]